MKIGDMKIRKMVATFVGVSENEAVAGIYTIASLILFMLVASSEHFVLLLIAVANLYIAVRNLQRIEDKRKGS